MPVSADRESNAMSELEKLKSEARKIANKIGDIEDEATRKTNGQKVGKFFRTRNCFSCPEKPSDYWWVYCHVTRMGQHGWLYTNQFEVDKHGSVHARFDYCAMHLASSDWQPISEATYQKAWERLVKKANSAIQDPRP